MNLMQRLSVATRMQLLVALTLIGLIVLSATALFQIRAGMLEDRKEKIKNLTEVAVSTLAYYHEQAKSGKMSEAEAKQAAHDNLKALRYAGNEYYFIYYSDGISFMHPIKPEFEGTNKLDLKDSTGKLIIVEMIAAAEKGGGFVDFLFPRAGQQTPEPKLSYGMMFKPWNLMVGTGIYIDDIDQEFRKIATLLGGISLGLLLLLSVLGYRIGVTVLKQLGGEPRVAAEIMQKVADGDLTASVENAPSGSLLHTLAGMVGALRQMVGAIESDARQLASNAEAIATASDGVSQAADQQADATSAMAAAIEQLTVSSTHISESARETSHDSTEAVELSGQGTERVQQASAAIEKISSTVSDASTRIRALEERADQVSSIANVIKDIAGQTNLLALNAAIEAARAGEQGRGFAVVADEVRKLAERTSVATTEIEQMIAGIQSDTREAVAAMDAALPEVQRGVELAASASESLQAIESGARRTLERIGEVADATQEQSAASTSIAQRVEQIANMVEETTTTIRGTAATAHQLEQIAHNLKQLVSRFKV